MRRYYVFIVLLFVFATAALLGAFAIRRGPAHDARVVSDFEAIRSALPGPTRDSRDRVVPNLPSNLSTLALADSTRKRLGDYSYAVTAPAVYSLCATFQTATNKAGNAMNNYTSYVDFSVHPKGRYCFHVDQTQ